MSGALADKIVKAWYRKAFWIKLFWPFSLLFALVSGFRRWRYRRSWKTLPASNVPVIVIGNLTVGGAGKSPLASYLVRALREQGFKPGIVSRGYGAQKPIDSAVLVTEQSTADQVGDEPLMLFQMLACPVCVCPERNQAVRALEQAGCDLILSDDGLQHYAMQRDLEICVFDAERLWGNGQLLPAGPMRESLKRLQSVDFVVLNGQLPEDQSAQDYLHSKLEQDGYASKSIKAPVLNMTLAPEDLKSLDSAQTLPLESLKEQKVAAVAGIGNPERFFATLSQLGARVEGRAFADHHAYQVDDFRGLDSALIVMTEKDAVKCRNLALDNLWYLPVRAQLSDNLAQKICERLESMGRLPKIKKTTH